ncbi:MAG: methyltransferase domain-containing protein [Burkholderiaceae bacterium]
MHATEGLDPLAARRQFARRGAALARADFLYREVERQMLERLDVIRLAPERMLDVGCGLGRGLLALAQRYAQAQGVGVDFCAPVLTEAARALRPAGSGWLARLLGGRPSSASRLHLICADAAALPLPAASADLVWSNLCLHWVADPAAALRDWYRVIRPGGLVMFSLFGVDTLREIRGDGKAVQPFADMHDIGDALREIGFADPVMDTQWITVTFDSPRQLLADVKALGGNAWRLRRGGLSGRDRQRRWLEALAQQRDDNGRIALTFEIVFGHAWCPEEKRRADGLVPIRLERPGRAP